MVHRVEPPSAVHSRPSAHSADTLAPEFILILTINLALVAISIIDALIRWRLQGATVAFSALFLENPVFDLTCYQGRFTNLHNTHFYAFGGQPWTYPAPCAFIYRAIYKGFSVIGFPWVEVLLGTPLLAAAILYTQQLARAGMQQVKAAAFVLTLILFSWPIYFSFQRGNIEGILWLLLAAALTFYVQGRWSAAAVVLGFVAAFKIYPILFIGLFLPARRYLEAVEALLAAVVTTLAGLRFLDHDIRRSAHFIAESVRLFVQLYSAHYIPLVSGYDHSAWGLIKRLLSTHPLWILRGTPVYTLVAGVLATLLYLAKVWHAPRFNQLLILCVLMVLLPATSFDYTLQALYIPFAWLCLATVRARRSGRTLKGAAAYFTTFGLLFGPLTFVRVNGITLDGQLKSCVLFVLLYVAVRYPLPALDRTEKTGVPAVSAATSTATPS